MIIMLKETEITMEKAKEMEDYIKINATETTCDISNCYCGEFNSLDLKYYLYYENESLVKIVRFCKIDDAFTVEYRVEQPKTITIYGTKITYTKKDIDLVNRFISECNGYVKDYNGIEVPTHTHSIMVNRGLCDFNFDDTIINCKYGYSLLEKDGEAIK